MLRSTILYGVIVEMINVCQCQLVCQITRSSDEFLISDHRQSSTFRVNEITSKALKATDKVIRDCNRNDLICDIWF